MAGTSPARPTAFVSGAEAAARQCLADGDLAGAAGNWARVLNATPDAHDVRYNLARALSDLGRPEASERVYLSLIQRVPNHVDALYNLGNLGMRVGDAHKAMAWYRQALAAAPERTDCRLNLGMALKAAGRSAEAETVYRETIRRRPDWAEAHWNLAVLLLSRGRWAEGFAEYQWRLRRYPTPDFTGRVPDWDGSAASGRHLLLWAEQGIGDAIQFLRYVRFAAQRTGRITVCCHRALGRLAQRAAGVARVVSFGEALPKIDLQAPLMSLPHLLGMTDPAASWHGPYLAGPWPLDPTPGPVRIGLVWSGNSEFSDNARRSCPPERLRPLTTLPGTAWYALQKGAAAEAEGRRVLGDGVVDLAPTLNDFADTARAVMGLDLVVTVDTAVAHLAGALGKPAWLLLHHAPDWRWQDAGRTTDWYPTLRLFRQPSPGDWTSVVDDLCRELPHWIENRFRKAFS